MIFEENFHPDEHACLWPDKVEHLNPIHDFPVIDVVTCRFRVLGLLGEYILVLFEDIAHGSHASLVSSAQTFQPAYPAVHVPTLTVFLFRDASSIGTILLSHDHFSDQGLDK